MYARLYVYICVYVCYTLSTNIYMCMNVVFEIYNIPSDVVF